MLVAGLVGLVGVGVPAVAFLAEYGCGEREERLGAVLARESVLGAAPEGARQRERYRGCDDDDRRVVAGAAYRYGGSAEQALRHYGGAAPAAGWRGTDVPGCFVKEVDGTTAHLAVEGPKDGELLVEILADREASALC